MTLGLTAAFPQARHEAAVAERRRKRDEALANASPEEAIEEGEVDWAGQRTELALEGLVDALRGAVDAANMRRPAAPLAFIAATLRGTQYEEPGGRGVRVDAFGYAGYQCSTNYDSMLAKVICHSGAADYESAVSKTYRALREFQIAGVQTNIPFLLNMLANEQ